MPILPVPRPTPIPIPWPSPVPGIPIPAPAPILNPPNLPHWYDPFSDLFKFGMDWKFLGAFLFLAITVELVDSNWPEYGFGYASVLLLGLMIVNRQFGTNIRTLLGG